MRYRRVEKNNAKTSKNVDYVEYVESFSWLCKVHSASPSAESWENFNIFNIFNIFRCFDAHFFTTLSAKGGGKGVDFAKTILRNRETLNALDDFEKGDFQCT